jgi:hypothetical protein
VDVKPLNGKYAWSNRRLGLGHIVVDIDRFLNHSDLLLNNNIIYSRIIPSGASYHKPISISFHHFQD